MKKSIFLLLISIPCFLKANPILNLPLPQKGDFIEYRVHSGEQKCSFSAQAKMLTKAVSKDSVRELNFWEKIYFEVKESRVQDGSLFFKLSGFKNVRFHFFYRECELKKEIKIDRQTFAFDKIDILYREVFGAAVLEETHLISKGKIVKVYPYSLKGHTPFYTLKVGGALSIRNNIRIKNEIALFKNPLIFQPRPGFILRVGGFFMNQDGLGHALYASENLSVLATSLLDGQRYKRAGFKRRKRGVFLGTIIKWKNLRFRFSNDFIFQEKGGELRLTYEHEFRMKLDLIIKPRIYIQRWDLKYSNYYFGVNHLDEHPQKFQLNATYNYSAMIKVIKNYKRWGFFLDTGVKFLDEEIRQSPTSSGKSDLKFTFGAFYKII